MLPRRGMTRSRRDDEQSTTRARRHHSSDSAFSNNSSSSSGIDPGCYDSATLVDKTTPAVETVPRKPPRLFNKMTSLDDKFLPSDHSSTLDCVDAKPVTKVPTSVSCDKQQMFRHQGATGNKSTPSEPVNRKLETAPLRVSPQSSDCCPSASPTSQHRGVGTQTRLMSPRRSRRHHAGVMSPVSVTSSPSGKPSKSILRRHHQQQQQQRNKSDDQSSWSDNHDSDLDDSSSCCQINDVIEPPSTVAMATKRSERPLSLPDAAILYMNLAQRNPAVDVNAKRSDDVTRVENELCGDDGADDVNCEQFRAKKSVSFSEKIFYHSMPPTVSPIESPLCPPATSCTSPSEDKSKLCTTTSDVITTCAQQTLQMQESPTVFGEFS